MRAAAQEKSAARRRFGSSESERKTDDRTGRAQRTFDPSLKPELELEPAATPPTPLLPGDSTESA